MADSTIVDISRQPITEKFSFIYTLSLSSSSDLDRQALDRLAKLAQEELAAKSTTADNNCPNSSNLSSTLTAPDEPASTINAQWYQTESSANFSNLDLSAIAASCGPAETVGNFSQPRSNYLSKLLLAGSCTYMMLAVWWFFGHHGKYLLATIGGKQNVILSKSDAEFIDYMERSLAAIDSENSQRDDNAAKDRDSQVVYVPVYSPQTTASNAQPLTTLPQTSIATNQPPAIAPPLEAIKIPSPPPLPAPTPMAESSTSSQTDASKTATASVSKPTVEHTLIGILELGDRSAALFKIKGATKQIWQGQEINNSGWTLESVTEQEVQISHQGEVRTLSVGEKF